MGNAVCRQDLPVIASRPVREWILASTGLGQTPARRSDAVGSSRTRRGKRATAKGSLGHDLVRHPCHQFHPCHPCHQFHPCQPCHPCHRQKKKKKKKSRNQYQHQHRSHPCHP